MMRWLLILCFLLPQLAGAQLAGSPINSPPTYPTTGTGNMVLSASPTLTGTALGANLTLTSPTGYTNNLIVQSNAADVKMVLGTDSGGAGIAGTTTNHNLSIIVNGTQVGLFRTNGLNNAAVGATAPSTGAFTTLSGSSTITLSGLSTGTNADFLCLSAGGVVLLQTSACTISSLRFKTDVIRFQSSGLDRVMSLRPIVFRMKPGERPNADINYDRPQIGLAAENVAKVDRRLAIYEDDGITPKSYRQESLIALLVKSTQEQQGMINRLRRQVRHLQHLIQ